MTGVAGIGSDLISCQRVEKALEHLGERFARRILTEPEMVLWESRGRSANFLAKQFAAKEALSKALGTGIAKGVSFHHFDVTRTDAGQPVATLSGVAQDLMVEMGGQQALISLTDEGDMIMAFALITR